MDRGAAGAASGLGKVRLLLAAGSGGGGKRGGGDPLVRGQKCGIGETPCRSWVRESEARRARGGHGEGADRGSPVWSPGLRPPARGSLQSPRNPSALRVWQCCKEKGSSGAARSCSSPSCPPTPSTHPGSRVLPLPALRPRPPARDPARNRSPCRANLEQPLASLGRNLGQLGLEEHPILGPGTRELPERMTPRGRGKEPTGFGVLLGARKEPAAVPGARIAAWLEAGSALGDCLQR